MIVEEKAIIEIKSVESISNVHLKQLLTYVRVTDLRLDLLINFNENFMLFFFNVIARLKQYQTKQKDNRFII